MRRYTLTLLICLLACAGYAQVSSRKYVDSHGQPVDSARADSYFLITKAATDSVWSVNQFAMSGWLMAIENYKDEKLTIRHGRFTYYALLGPSVRVTYNFELHRIDTIHSSGHIVTSRGSYINGKKWGEWMEYDTLSGGVKTEGNYKAGKLNGPYKMFGVNGRISFEGNYTDGLKEGEWHLYASDGQLMQTYTYQNDNIVKQVAAPPVEDEMLSHSVSFLSDLTKYTNRQLTNTLFSSAGDFHASYGFTIAADGSLAKPSILVESTMEIDTALVNTLLSAPYKLKVKPGDKAVIGHAYLLAFTVAVDKKRRIQLRPVVMYRTN